MHSWIVEAEKLKSLAEEISKADKSPILVSDSQKTDRVEEVKQAEIDELYPDAKRVTLRRRLEEMAYVFYRLEEEEFARLALSAAVSLEKKETIFGANPFLKALVERSLMYFEQMVSQGEEPAKEEEEDPPRIILP
jgi:hypothetical protein